MGFDTTAYDTDEKVEPMEDGGEYENLEDVAYHRAFMGGFRMMAEQGYDWFDLIDADDCYGGVSGNGTSKLILLSNLKNALKVILNHKPTNLASNFDNPDSDYFNERKQDLQEFMEKCIDWCEKNKKEKILIYFG